MIAPMHASTIDQHNEVISHIARTCDGQLPNNIVPSFPTERECNPTEVTKYDFS